MTVKYRSTNKVIIIIINNIILSDVYCEISRVVKGRIARVPKARVRCGALTTSAHASAHVHNSSNHSYVSMNMDSIDDRPRAVLSPAPRYLSQPF